MLIGTAVMTAIYIWLLLGVERRQSWARWVLLAYLGLGWIVLLADPQLEQGVPAVVIDIAIGAAEIYACVLLFAREGREWFRA
jgi:hypothetical protein